MVRKIVTRQSVKVLPFTCQHCGVGCASQKNLDRHIRRCHKEKLVPSQKTKKGRLAQKAFPQPVQLPRGYKPQECPYCGQAAVILRGNFLYPGNKTLHNFDYWVCKPCDARIKCLSGTYNPQGTMANKELRLLRTKTVSVIMEHQRRYDLTAAEVYSYIGKELFLNRTERMPRNYDKETCKAVIKLFSTARHPSEEL